MKKITIFFSLFLLCVVCSNAKRNHNVSATNSIKIITATLDGKKYFHPKGVISMSGVKYHDLYFCWFIEEAYYDSYEHLFVFSEEGKFIQEISLPEKCHKTHFGQMFVRNDSLLVDTYYNDYPNFHICLVDSSWTIVETQKLSKQIFEDTYFQIYYIDMGEWGKYLHFVDKKTNALHTYYGTGTRIIKLDDGYYIYGEYSVFRISNPCEGKINDHKVFDISGGYIPYSRSEELIRFKDKSDNSFFYKSDSTIATVSHVNGKTLAIINDKKESFVAEINGKSIKQLYSIGGSLGSIYGTKNFGRNINDNYSSCYYSLSNNQFGILELDGDKVTIFKVTITNPTKKSSRRH